MRATVLLLLLAAPLCAHDGKSKVSYKKSVMVDPDYQSPARVTPVVRKPRIHDWRARRTRYRYVRVYTEERRYSSACRSTYPRYTAVGATVGGIIGYHNYRTARGIWIGMGVGFVLDSIFSSCW